MATFSESTSKMLEKLLDKAGKDPRLTPRILREKAEQKLSIEPGSLKKFRKEIKTLIYEWWNKQNSLKNPSEEESFLALTKLAKASGNASLLQDLPDKDKNRVLSERLKSKGLIFADIPTANDIAKAKKNYEQQKDLLDLDIDSSQPLKKRRAEDSTITTSSTSSCIVPSKGKIQYDSEEAEF